MSIDTFLANTEQRIPTVEEMIELCNDLRITFTMVNGKPALRPCPDCVHEAKVLAKLFSREPFRSEVLAAKLPEAASPEVLKAEEPDTVAGPEIPQGASIVVADPDGRTGHEMKGPPFMWTFTGAKTWYYVSQHPIPS